MATLLLSSKPYYDQYATFNNFKTDQFDDNDAQSRTRYHRERREERRRPFPHMDPRYYRPRRRSFSPMSNNPHNRRSRRHPHSRDGKRALTCELNLGSNKSSVNGLRWKPRTNTWPDLSPAASSRTLERLNILASTTYSDEQGDAAVEVQCDSDKQNQDDHFIHWLHIQRPDMDLDEFERLALQSPRISDEMALVVSHLMTKVRKELEKAFVHGRYMLPGAFRCDGRDTSKNEKEDISAVWMCIPYFSMKTDHQFHGKAPSTSNLHPLRTLLQSCYDFESTRDRDSGHHGHHKIGGKLAKTVYLPQLWCFILGSGKVLN
jgi:hypothetical protein